MQIAKFIFLTGVVAFAATLVPMGVEAGDGVYSLRGKRALETISETPNAAGVILPIAGVHGRSFQGQPPQVPHKVKANRISLKKNQCLECHGDGVYEQAGTTMVHRSHFINRAGKNIGRVSTRFYFCNQCHVQQLNKTPLVLNNFATTVKLMVKKSHKNDVFSLRGNRRLNDVSDTPDVAGVILPIKGTHDRSYTGQPPMVPHKVKAKRISIKRNQCLECHGDLNAEEIGATQVHRSHFVNRAGERLGKISTRFYFCTQCHAQQSDRSPLVANNFRR